MEEKNYISIPFARENEVKEERTDPLAPTYPTWSTRWRCCQTYLCLSMSFLSVMKFCESLTEFGFVVLVPYLIFTIVLGAPGVLAEILLGRYGGGNVVRTWSMCPPARGLFVCLFIVTCFLVIERNLLSVYIMKYFFSCFYGSMQWGDCRDNWAKDNCFKVGKKRDSYLRCLTKHSEEYCNGLKWETSATQYLKYVITSTKGLHLLWTIICLTISILINLALVFKGIYSLDKTLAYLVYPIFVFYVILGIVSLSVPNAVKGFIKLCSFGWGNISNIKYSPVKYSACTNPSVNNATCYRILQKKFRSFVRTEMCDLPATFTDKAGIDDDDDDDDLQSTTLWLVGFFDIFLSNCVGTLSLSFISGHGKFTDNILLEVFTVTFISFISCLIFTVPFLCVIKSIRGVDSEQDDIVGVFVNISQAFLLYPIPKVLWTGLYFLTAYFMSLSSQSILFLALAESLQNIFKKKSMSFWITVVSGVSFAATIVVDVLRLRVYVEARTALSVNFLLTTLTWQAFYGIENFKTDFHYMMGYPVPFLVRCTWIIPLVLPIVLLLLLIFYTPPNSLMKNIHDLIFCGVFILIYIFNIIFYLIRTKRQKGKIKTVFRANPDWGPDNPLLKKSRVLFGVSSVTREFTYRQELNKKPLVKPPEFSKQNIVYLT